MTPSRAERYDAVVVGASTSGLHTAWALAAAGRSVAVLERKADHTRPGRSWIVTDRLLQFLPDLPAEAVLHRTGIMEVTAGGATAAVRLARSDLIVERTAVMHHLRARAVAAGVTLVEGVDVRDVGTGASGLVVEAVERKERTTRRFLARDVVGADGVASTVATRFGAGRQRAVPIVQAEVNLPDGYDPDVTRVWFDRDRTRFFFWLIPCGDASGVLGWVAESPADGRAPLERHIGELGLEVLGWEGAMIPLHRPRRRIEWRIGRSRVLLVGDAAAHVKVTTVGGLVSGLWGAAAAAGSLLDGRSYARHLVGLHAELYVHDLIRWGLDRFDQRGYELLVGRLDTATLRLLSRRNRDTVAGAFHRLLGQPRLLALAVRALLLPHRVRGGDREPRRLDPSLASTSGSGEG